MSYQKPEPNTALFMQINKITSAIFKNFRINISVIKYKQGQKNYCKVEYFGRQ